MPCRIGSRGDESWNGSVWGCGEANSHTPGKFIPLLLTVNQGRQLGRCSAPLPLQRKRSFFIFCEDSGVLVSPRSFLLPLPLPSPTPLEKVHFVSQWFLCLACVDCLCLVNTLPPSSLSSSDGRPLCPPACVFLRWRPSVREIMVLCQPHALRIRIRAFSGKIMPPRGRETTASVRDTSSLCYKLSEV